MTTGSTVVCVWATGDASLPAGLAQNLTLARRLGDGGGRPVRALGIGRVDAPFFQQAARFGVVDFDRICDEGLVPSSTDRCVEALAGYCALRQPAVLLFAQDTNTRVIAGRLAARLRTGVVTNGAGLSWVVWDPGRPDGCLQVETVAFGSAARTVYEFGDTTPRIVCMLDNAVEPVACEPPGQVAIQDLPAPPACSERVRVLQAAGAVGPKLEHARIIVAGGRGLRSASNYALVEQLAETLSGLPAASRPLADDGWTDAARWVGLTGKVVAPDLYLACGISGASQHMAGISGAKTIVAINTDRDAPIFRYARYGVVGDAVAILPELIRLSRQE